MKQSLADSLLRIQNALCDAEKPVRILRNVAWPASVRAQFFADDCRELPKVKYEDFDQSPSCDATVSIRRDIKKSFGQNNAIADWLQRQADMVDTGARLLAARETPEFLGYSEQLYGVPTGLLPDEKTSVLSLAESFDDLLERLDGLKLDLPENEVTAEHLAQKMQKAVAEMFAEKAPEVQLVDELSANALAGSRRIRIRRGAMFNDKDLAALIHHEAFIHVATSLNGREQPYLPMLARSHPGTTRTQEGLAVFAEFITGSMEPVRLRRLTDRVIAIQMAIEGADFIQVFEYFLERVNGNRKQAYEDTRRVFRGGVLSGGAPFTKDIVYLEGLLRVHNFLRICVSAGRPDLLRLLFCGKLDLEDINALAELAAVGICKPPRFLPNWADDLRFLLSYLAYSAFLNTVGLEKLHEHYAQLTKTAPTIENFVA